MKKRSKNIHFFRILRNLFLLAGIFFVICLITAFTEKPYWGYHWLGTSKSELKWKPGTIVMLGGGGIPSESNLMRSWYVSHAYKSFPEANVLIAMPGDTSDTLGTPQRMKDELIIRGIPFEKIYFEAEGKNTRAQALNCLSKLGMEHPVLIITSPDHMRRAVLCFKKVGFEKVNALPAFENAVEADLKFDDDALGGNKTLLPDVGKSISIRYQFWNHLKYEILIAREITALAYYKLRRWI